MADPAHDHAERYYAEKLWALIPEYYRELDGTANPPGVLRGLAETLAVQAATLRRSIDRLWDDQFIDLCSDWAVPYLGQLVATRMVSALARRARRIDVAKTVYYRRRAGTPRVLEELIADITGWEGKVVEEFRRLLRSPHGLDLRPGPRAGLRTGTMPGGWADLRSPHGAELAGSPFDEYSHFPDGRRPRGGDGLYGITRLGFHLYRLPATPLVRVTPFAVTPGGGRFTFDASGRDLALFAKRTRADDRAVFDWEQWISAQEWEVPAPIRCRELNDAPLEITEKLLTWLAGSDAHLSQAEAQGAAAWLRGFRDARIPSEARLWDLTAALTPPLRDALRKSATWNPLLAEALAAACGKRGLLPQGGCSGDPNPDSSATDTSGASVVVLTFRQDLNQWVPVPRELIVACDLSQWTVALPGAAKQWAVDPKLGRLLWLGQDKAPPPLVSYYYGFSGPIGAGGYDRANSFRGALTGSIQGGGPIQTGNPQGKNYLPPGGANGALIELADSANYTPIENRDQITQLELRAADRQRSYLQLTQDWQLNASAKPRAVLTLNGLWVGAAGAFAVQLQGDYQLVTLRHMTLDPGGLDAAGKALNPVALAIQGRVERLVIEQSIIGLVRLEAGAEVSSLEISDSIVDGQQSPAPVLALPSGRLTLRRVTVFGQVQAEWLDASEALITDATSVVNTQDGCFRFGAVLAQSRVPRSYESHFLQSFAGMFTSCVFGQPGYAQLAAEAPVGLQRGAANTSEIGAFSGLLNPIKFDSLRAKVDEFAPFGLLPVYIFQT